MVLGVSRRAVQRMHGGLLSRPWSSIDTRTLRQDAFWVSLNFVRKRAATSNSVSRSRDVEPHDVQVYTPVSRTLLQRLHTEKVWRSAISPISRALT